MSLIIFDIDKVIRNTFKFKFKNKEYLITEPTVKAWAEINEYNLEQQVKCNFKESIKFLCEKLCPDLIDELNNMVNNELITVFNVLMKILSGDGEGKSLTPAEIMKKV